MYSEVLNEKLSEKLLNIAGQQLESDKGTLSKISKELGYANPANLVKAIYNFSSKATWATNDFATLQAVFEGMEHGKSMEAAIGEVSKHIPNYRIPSEVMGSRFISSIMRGESGLTMFGSYHYGALKSYGEMLSDVKKGLTGEDPQKAAEALDKISALVIATYFVYPQLDNIAQYVTGNPNASVKRAGASTFLYNSQQFAQKAMSHRGATSADVSQFVQRTITPSIGLTAGMELYYGRDMHNGRAFNYGQKMASYISPLDYGMKVYQGKKSPSATGWGLMSINSPKHAYR